MNWILDWTALKLLNGLPFPVQVYGKRGKQMQEHGCYLQPCQSISLFYLWLGQRPEVIVDIKGTFNSMYLLLEYDNTGTLIHYESTSPYSLP